MSFLWTGLFLLSASLMTGAGYYRASAPATAVILLMVGTALILWSQVGPVVSARYHATAEPAFRVPVGFPGRRSSLICLLALIPTLLLFPWQQRAAGLLLAMGLIVGWTKCACSGGPKPASSNVPGQDFGTQNNILKSATPGCFHDALSIPLRYAIARGLVLSGVILWAQMAAFLAYRTWTSYSHEMPWPLPFILALPVRLIGVETSVEKSSIMLFTMRQVHALGATWELVLDPITFGFLVSSAAVLCWLAVHRVPATAADSSPRMDIPPGRKPGKKELGPKARSVSVMSVGYWRTCGTLFGPWAAAVAVWLPIRVTLLVGSFLHRALITEYDEPLDLMRPFWDTWVLICLGLPLAWVQARWLRNRTAFPSTTSTEIARPSQEPWWRMPACAAVAIACLTLGVLWDPVGHRKQGRVVVDEYHSKWEPTDKPFDTEYYGHLSGYNYACIYDYCSRFYSMSRLTNAVDEASLANVDVFVVKVPTEPYSDSEIDVLMRFVRRGGGLLLIGEHTDVFGTGYKLNAIARRLGFEFRYDCLFGIDSFFDQYFVPPFVPHPVVQHLRGMDFATSCSIRPFQFWRGRSVITSAGLKNSMADYHASNYYPQASDHAAMRYGAFVQLWGARIGQGRILAFTDSTIFSNFCTFEPGKSELMLGMLEWLNRQDAIGNPRITLLILGVLAGTFAVARLNRRPVDLVPVVAAAIAAWSLTSLGVRTVQASRFPLPARQRPFVHVTIDRTACQCPLSKNGFIEGKNNGFGIFERWILRLGYFTRRVAGPEALDGDLMVFMYPDRAVGSVYVERLRRYVENGGRVLVVDSAQNTNSTAAAILHPFGLSQKPHPEPNGVLRGPETFPAIHVESANQTLGGYPFVLLNGLPVATLTRHGRGSVALIGFGARFTDSRMGVTGDVVPDSELRKVFDFQFALIRGLVEDRLPPDTAFGDAP